MKPTYACIRKFGVGCGLALALAAIGGMPSLAQAAEKGSAKGGASDLIQLKRIVTPEDVAALQPGDMIAMSCPKCKTIAVTHVVKEPKGNVTRMLPGEKHLCPGCQSTFEVKGHGKAKKADIVHTCQKCGSKSAYCCVLKKAGNPTKGMEPK
jgi:transposase-like protein